jgi:ketosteroid isomerase-like protein
MKVVLAPPPGGLLGGQSSSPSPPPGDTALTMSQEAVDLSRAAFERFAQGDFTAIADLPDEFGLVLAPEMPDAGTYRGGAARDWITAWVNSFERLTQEPVEFIDPGDDQVLVEFIQRGWTAGSDVPVETRTWSVSTVRNGYFLRWLLFQNRNEALEAAGLSE